MCGQIFLGRAHWDTESQLCDDKVHTVSKIFWTPANGHSSWFILFRYDSNHWKTESNEFEIMCSSFILAKKRFVYITETKHLMLHSFMLLQKRKCSAHDSCMQWREICGQMVLGHSHWDIELQLCHDKVHTVSKIFWVMLSSTIKSTIFESTRVAVTTNMLGFIILLCKTVFLLLVNWLLMTGWHLKLNVSLHQLQRNLYAISKQC